MNRSASCFVGDASKTVRDTTNNRRETPGFSPKNGEGSGVFYVRAMADVRGLGPTYWIARALAGYPVWRTEVC